MGLVDSLGTLTGFSSARDNEAAQRHTDATNDAYRSTLNNYSQGYLQDQALNSQLGNQNYYGNAQQVYGQQQTASNMLQGAANGTVPSAAAIQQGIGQQAANAGLQSAALSQQGAMNPALAARNMLNAQAQAQQGIVGNGIISRASEQAVARQQYSNLLNNMQSQQMQQGQLQYTQGQNMLGNQNMLHQQAYQNGNNTAGTIYNTQMGNLNGAAQSNQAQAAALGGTINSFSSGITGGIGGAQNAANMGRSQVSGFMDGAMK